jgi:hypothetical protein
MKAKSIHNPCPICQLPRGKGKYEFAHGTCMEQRAKIDGKKLVPTNNERFANITVEQREKTTRRRTAERFKAGKLRDWMYS